MLTTTWLTTGKAVAISTLFGLVNAPVRPRVRVWFHFILNLIATLVAWRAIAECRSAR